MPTLPLKQPSASRGERTTTASDQPDHADAASAEMRELVLDSLEMLAVPSPLRLVADVLAVQGQHVTLRQLARLRQSDRRELQATNPSSQRCLVPGLSTLDLTALNRTLALSTWPAEQRLVGSRSPRVHHLRVLLVLLDLDSPGELLPAMIARYAQTVPDATARGEPREVERVRAAAEAELQALVSLDADERRSAADRLHSLPLTYQLWGRLPLLDSGLEPSATSSEARP
jgi:hypothetical protein